MEYCIQIPKAYFFQDFSRVFPKENFILLLDLNFFFIFVSIFVQSLLKFEFQYKVIHFLLEIFLYWQQFFLVRTFIFPVNS